MWELAFRVESLQTQMAAEGGQISKIALIEDELDLAEEIQTWLARDKHVVEIITNGQTAIDVLRVKEFDLIILDLLLPGLSGFEVCKQFRDRGGITPLIMLTAQSSIENREKGLDLGADDYLCKPFDLKELSARVRALLRRTSNVKTNTVAVRNLTVDLVTRTVLCNGVEVHLEPKEYALLEFFIRNPNHVFAADVLLSRVWASDADVVPDSVRCYVKSLRKKLGSPDGAPLIATVHGLGYRFNA